MSLERIREQGLRVAEIWAGQIRSLGIEPDAPALERIRRDCFRDRPCPDCAAPLGRAHRDGCDVARCTWTGEQRLACSGTSDWKPCGCTEDPDDELADLDLEPHEHTCGQLVHPCGRQVWDGVWPGTREAVELGIYVAGGGPLPACGPEHPDATPDLNLVHWCTGWSRERGRRTPDRHTLGSLAGARRRDPAVARVGANGFVPWPPLTAPHESARWASCPGLSEAAAVAEREHS